MRREQAAPISFSGFDEGSVFRSIFSAYPDAMLLVGQDGRIVMSNPEAEILLGYSADEFASMSVDQLVPDSIRPRHASYRDAYGNAPRRRPMGTQMDLVARRKDGSEAMVEIALSPLQDHGLPFVVASIRDIGAYPRVQQALRRARYSEHLAQFGRIAVDERDAGLLLEHATRLAAQALEAPVAMVYLLDGSGRQFRIAARWGLLPEQALGETIPNTPGTLPGYLVERPQPLVLADYRQVADFTLPDHLLAGGLASGALMPLLERGRVLGVLAVHADRPNAFGDDERRFLESLSSLLATCLQRAQSEEALGHSQRLESVGQLTGGIAHDFNNLLTVIQGNLQIIEDLPALDGDANGQRMLAAATRATRRAAELTGKLLAFSRRQVLQPASIDVGTLLASLADMLRRTLDQRVVIEVDVAGECPAVLADPVQLESALLNIAINARDAMPDGGRLRFTVTAVDQLPDASGDAVPLAGAFVSISISDTGSGMPDAVRERAFEPFFTTKESGRGTGLGLSTVYGFVKQSRGAVTIESAPGAGTVVTLVIPRARQAAVESEAEAKAAAAAIPDPPVRRGLRVLFVEDDEAVRAVGLAFLASLDTVVTTCGNAEDALVALEAAEFDLLLSDVSLGAGMRGTELASRAQVRWPGLRVLLASGYSAELIDADHTAPPDWELVPKPYSRRDLARAIGRASEPHAATAPSPSPA